MDQRIFTARSACVLHTIQRKENSCPIPITMAITPDETRNRYYLCVLVADTRLCNRNVTDAYRWRGASGKTDSNHNDIRQRPHRYDA